EQAVGGAVSFILYDITHNHLLVAIQPESLMPVASAFKVGALLYFIKNVDQEIWNTLPVEFWNTLQLDNIPEQYQAHWQRHNQILRDLYRMTVFSDNDAVTRVLRYVSTETSGEPALRAFNDWSHEIVGLSQMSALAKWEYGNTTEEEGSDERFFGRETHVGFDAYEYGNMMTPRDLGLYYTWFLDQMTLTQQRVAGSLLNTVEDERRANIKKLAFWNDGVAISKNGSLGGDASPAGTVITDAGIVEHSNGSSYLISVMTIAAERAIPPLFELTNDVINGKYDASIRAAQRRLARTNITPHDYVAFLAEAYPDEGTVNRNHFNYAFIKLEGVPVYNRPDEASEMRNPVISSSRFGVHLLMQGALIRFKPVNRNWVEMIPDAPNDSVRNRLSDRIYLKREHIYPIPIEHTHPINYLVDENVTPSQKFVIINVGGRELVGVENESVVFKTPIALSTLYTPRGSYPLYNKWFSRSMQAWAPGVPFTAFFHVDGYAIHGSPWQRWEETVNRANLSKRISAGCINIPNWMVSLGDYTRPMDELIFRWLGGLVNPQTEVYEFPVEEYQFMRVYVVDRYQDLLPYNMPEKVVEARITWDRIMDDIIDIDPLAPDSFFRL
ncbi:MAG TPA: L,D-transpeptidase, partial [Aggregatilineales bacterium]|nr:L,D-transpeptidase [Aggregatilineales bacterium]